MASIPLRALDDAAFAPFGKILHIASPRADVAARGDNEFLVVDESTNGDGWRLAVQIVRRRTLTQVGHHPNTRETFEPVTGLTVICVAPLATPDELTAFVLDQPVVVNDHIWHGLIALSAEAIVKIAENREVVGVNHILVAPRSVVLAAS